MRPRGPTLRLVRPRLRAAADRPAEPRPPARRVAPVSGLSGPSERQATVRMYNVGFGDCFLLTLPGAGRPRKVLVDCGSHSHGSGPSPIGDVAARILEDVREEAGTPRIAAVV